MAETQIFGLFDSAENVAEVVGRLHELGVPEDRVTIYSHFPYKGAILGREHAHGCLPLVPVLGGLLGAAVAAFLTAGIWLIFPVYQGGQPLVPIPPSLVIFFEWIMLGVMWSTFFGYLWLNGLPVLDKRPYDPRITEGNLGLLAFVDNAKADEAEQFMRQHGAIDVQRETARPQVRSHRFAYFWGGAGVAMALFAGITLLFFYDVIKIPFPSNMIEQDSIAYDEGPRLAAPVDAVPVQGPVLISDQPASQPPAASSSSIQRGSVYYGLTCQICHGPQGKGNGPVGAFFNPKPFDLTSAAVKGMTDQQIFLVITQGFGVMPTIHENLTIEERWDVINYVRTLQK